MEVTINTINKTVKLHGSASLEEINKFMEETSLSLQGYVLVGEEVQPSYPWITAPYPIYNPEIT